MCKSCGCTEPEKPKDEPEECQPCKPEKISECCPGSEKDPCVEKKEE